jgi:hypothetical protein
MTGKMTMQSWYGAHHGRMVGPMTCGQLAELFARNEMDYVWCDALSDWEPASRVLGEEPATHPDESLRKTAGQDGITYTLVEGASLKFATIIWILAGLLIPLWPVSLPICWYRAYRSYSRPTCHTFVLRSA